MGVTERYSTPLGRVVVAGASGFVGQRLVASYRAAGRHVDLIGRREATTWDDSAAIAALMMLAAGALVVLANGAFENTLTELSSLTLRQGRGTPVSEQTLLAAMRALVAWRLGDTVRM